MTKTFHLNRQLITLGIPILMLLSLALLAKSTLFDSNSNDLSFAITFDLLITIPIVYFLLIRKSKIPVTTVVPVLILGLIIGTYTIPSENQLYLDLFKLWGLPVVELLVFSFIFFKLRSSIKKYKETKQTNLDFFKALKETCNEVIPKRLVYFFATEIAVIYYGFINWRKLTKKENEFTYHKNSGTPAVLVAIIFIVFVETCVVHFLLSKWSNSIAWILSGLSVYTAIQLFGFLKSLSQRLITIKNDQITIPYGILAETEIRIQDIHAVELSSNDLNVDDLTRKLSPLGEIESHNVLIKLNKEHHLIGMYGFKKSFTNLAFYVDDKDEFKIKLEAAMQQNKDQPIEL